MSDPSLLVPGDPQPVFYDVDLTGLEETVGESYVAMEYWLPVLGITNTISTSHPAVVFPVTHTLSKSGLTYNVAGEWTEDVDYPIQTTLSYTTAVANLVTPIDYNIKLGTTRYTSSQSPDVTTASTVHFDISNLYVTTEVTTPVATPNTWTFSNCNQQLNPDETITTGSEQTNYISHTMTFDHEGTITVEEQVSQTTDVEVAVLTPHTFTIVGERLPANWKLDTDPGVSSIHQLIFLTYVNLIDWFKNPANVISGEDGIHTFAAPPSANYPADGGEDFDGTPVWVPQFGADGYQNRGVFKSFETAATSQPTGKLNWFIPGAFAADGMPYYDGQYAQYGWEELTEPERYYALHMMMTDSTIINANEHSSTYLGGAFGNAFLGVSIGEFWQQIYMKFWGELQVQTGNTDTPSDFARNVQMDAYGTLQYQNVEYGEDGNATYSEWFDITSVNPIEPLKFGTAVESVTEQVTTNVDYTFGLKVSDYYVLISDDGTSITGHDNDGNPTGVDPNPFGGAVYTDNGKVEIVHDHTTPFLWTYGEYTVTDVDGNAVKRYMRGPVIKTWDCTPAQLLAKYGTDNTSGAESENFSLGFLATYDSPEGETWTNILTLTGDEHSDLVSPAYGMAAWYAIETIPATTEAISYFLDIYVYTSAGVLVPEGGGVHYDTNAGTISITASPELLAAHPSGLKMQGVISYTNLAGQPVTDLQEGHHLTIALNAWDPEDLLNGDASWVNYTNHVVSFGNGQVSSGTHYDDTEGTALESFPWVTIVHPDPDYPVLGDGSSPLFIHMNNATNLNGSWTINLGHWAIEETTYISDWDNVPYVHVLADDGSHSVYDESKWSAVTNNDGSGTLNITVDEDLVLVLHSSTNNAIWNTLGSTSTDSGDQVTSGAIGSLSLDDANNYVITSFGDGSYETTLTQGTPPASYLKYMVAPGAIVNTTTEYVFQFWDTQLVGGYSDAADVVIANGEATFTAGPDSPDKLYYQARLLGEDGYPTGATVFEGDINIDELANPNWTVDNWNADDGTSIGGYSLNVGAPAASTAYDMGQFQHTATVTAAVVRIVNGLAVHLDTPGSVLMGFDANGTVRTIGTTLSNTPQLMANDGSPIDEVQWTYGSTLNHITIGGNPEGSQEITFKLYDSTPDVDAPTGRIYDVVHIHKDTDWETGVTNVAWQPSWAADHWDWSHPSLGDNLTNSINFQDNAILGNSLEPVIMVIAGEGVPNTGSATLQSGFTNSNAVYWLNEPQPDTTTEVTIHASKTWANGAPGGIWDGFVVGDNGVINLTISKNDFGPDGGDFYIYNAADPTDHLIITVAETEDVPPTSGITITATAGGLTTNLPNQTLFYREGDSQTNVTVTVAFSSTNPVNVVTPWVAGIVEDVDKIEFTVDDNTPSELWLYNVDSPSSYIELGTYSTGDAVAGTTASFTVDANTFSLDLVAFGYQTIAAYNTDENFHYKCVRSMTDPAVTFVIQDFVNWASTESGSYISVDENTPAKIWWGGGRVDENEDWYSDDQSNFQGGEWSIAGSANIAAGQTLTLSVNDAGVASWGPDLDTLEYKVIAGNSITHGFKVVTQLDNWANNVYIISK